MKSYLKITSKDLQRLGIIDEIIEEPIGGAHRERPQIIMQTKLAILKNLNDRIKYIIWIFINHIQ